MTNVESGSVNFPDHKRPKEMRYMIMSTSINAMPVPMRVVFCSSRAEISLVVDDDNGCSILYSFSKKRKKNTQKGSNGDYTVFFFFFFFSFE